MIAHRRLEWRCRRGVRELDLLLRWYLQQSYDQAPVGEQQLFAELLELSDPQLQSLLLTSEPAHNRRFDRLVGKIRQRHPL